MTDQKSLSIEDRARALNLMASDEFDLAIIGGGIAGAGAARDAASRGLRVALIEGSDFASGTSSRSSKLIHGGIRYLENHEFHLVFEALSERQRLFEIAPHLVHPLRFLLPIYRTGRVPAWLMGIGMWVYDALSLFEAPELNQFLDVSEIQLEYPALQTQGLDGAFAYYDAYMDDDRLVHETLRSAATLGAELANYTRATGVEMRDGIVQSLVCEDMVTGTRFNLKARHYVSTVGPWTDQLGEVFFCPWKKALRTTKGVHLTFKKERFPLKDAVVMGAESRIVFAIPRHDMVIVGTTDTDYSGDPAEVRAEKEDVNYLLMVIRQYFPGVKITKSDIVGCYAGVRPLVDDGSQTEGKTSREHSIWTDSRGVTFVAGGKYTTYRRMAEDTIETVLAQFSIEDRVQYSKPNTIVPLNPLVSEDLLRRAKVEHVQWAKQWGIPTDVTQAMAGRHGLEAELIILNSLDLLEKIDDAHAWMWCAEARHAIEHTMCLTLKDFFLRRTHLVLSRADHGRPFVKIVVKTMAERLGWDSERISSEINALQNHLEWELAATISS